MIARIGKKDGRRQLLGEHCRNALRLAHDAADVFGLGNVAALAGLLHDMGKATGEFLTYLEWSWDHPGNRSQKGNVHHAPIGAIFAYERWYRGGSLFAQKTAQIISMAILGHHGGLRDCVTPDGDSAYMASLLRDKKQLLYDEAVTCFLTTIAAAEELDALFSAACEEVERFLNQTEQRHWAFAQGMLARLVLSLLVDADRWDSACFEDAEDPFLAEERADWNDLSARLERTLATYSRETPIGALRGEVSDRCAKAADAAPEGIYTLTVPTGGGKTLSSLRFALRHAAGRKERIFYIIPFNTILEQNSGDIREALEGYDGILEHYGTFLSELEAERGEQEENEHLRLTERWNMPIVMTSVVQFLNALFRAENSDVRRMHRLANSILIFDEIQALPKHCTALFAKAIRFLADCLHCTVLLCTATQPQLDVQAQPLLRRELTEKLQRDLKRVELIDDSASPKDDEQAARDIATLHAQYGSALVVVNTKAVAADLLARLKKMPVEAMLVHLSTNMCAAHRFAQVAGMKKALEDKSRKVLCVSTALIEAGVNISFPCAVRSLTGLPSILQTAGRCNRNMEMEKAGKVFIWNLSEEKTGRLKEVEIGRSCTWSAVEAIAEGRAGGALDSAEALEFFFAKERTEYGEHLFEYPWKEQKPRNATLTDMLCKNDTLREHTEYAGKTGRRLDDMRLYQAFKTAGHAFRAIDQDTVSVIVPFGEGEEVIAQLCSDQPLRERIRTKRRAQQYTVAIWRDAFERLRREGAIYPAGDSAEYALAKEYYSDELGLLVKPGELEFMNY